MRRWHERQGNIGVRKVCIYALEINVREQAIHAEYQYCAGSHCPKLSVSIQIVAFASIKYRVSMRLFSNGENSPPTDPSWF